MLKDRLKEARKKANKSQKDVVDAIGITQSALSQLETGRVDSSSHLPAIANFLGVDAYWLQTGEHSASIKDQEFHKISAWDEKTPLEDDEVEIPFLRILVLPVDLVLLMTLSLTRNANYASPKRL